MPPLQGWPSISTQPCAWPVFALGAHGGFCSVFLFAWTERWSPSRVISRSLRRVGFHRDQASPSQGRQRTVRVLQLHTRYREQGGEDAVVRAEADLLRRHGHEVIQHEIRNPPDAVRATMALALAPWNPLEARVVRGIAEETRPDVVHVHNTWYAMSPAVLWTLRRLGVPVVVTLHNFRLLCANGQLFREGAPCEDCIGSHPWHGVRHRCYRGSGLLSIPPAGTIALHRRLGTWERCVDLFLVLNEFARACFVRGGLPAERIRVKPNFVVDPGRRPMPVSKSRTVLYVGRVSPEKGVEVLVEAWRHVAAETTLELVIVGDGPSRSNLELRAMPSIQFVGHLPAAQVREWMHAARTLALPSIWYEGQPIVALEALAAGLPVLASRIGGMPDLLGPLGHEWLVPSGVVEDWSNALGELQEPGRVEEGSQRARARYEEAFTEAAAAAALEDAYECARGRASGAVGE
jgi:glycosyltransferase involved in cell wall biosynthesis